jgi:hypothetical protein
MQISYRAHRVEAVFEGGKGRRLREKHQKPVKAFVQMRIAFWFEEL